MTGSPSPEVAALCADADPRDAEEVVKEAARAAIRRYRDEAGT